MRKILPYLIGLCLALWFGGLMALFMFVVNLFKINRGTAVNAAPTMFHIFERYQLMLAAIAIATVIVWRLYSCSKPKKYLLACLLAATCFAVANFAIISPRMNELLAGGEGGEAEFKKLHGYSMMLYVGTTVFVLLAGGSFIAAMQRDQSFSGISNESVRG